MLANMQGSISCGDRVTIACCNDAWQYSACWVPVAACKPSLCRCCARKSLQSSEALPSVDARHPNFCFVHPGRRMLFNMQAKEKALAGVRAQIAERDQQIAHKDALIAQLVAASPKAAPRANGSASSEGQKGGGGGGAGGLFSKLRTNLARGPVGNLIHVFVVAAEQFVSPHQGNSSEIAPTGTH